MPDNVPQIDLDAYFERIGWGGPTTPRYDTLAGLLAAHMSRIPFEALDVLLGRPVRLELDALQRKLVRNCRGGYCFEHATLFAAVLEELGFETARHTARVTLTVPRQASPRTHMVLTVPMPEGTFIVDPGLGGLAPRVPVPLIDGAQARADHEVHWMARDANQWILRSRSGENTVDCWVSSLEADNPIDFEVGNHYTATHPMSPFLNRIMLRALTSTGRVTVLNREVTVRDGVDSRSYQLADRVALRSLLVKYFGFDLPEVERLLVPMIPEWS